LRAATFFATIAVMEETFAPGDLLPREEVRALSRRADGPALAMLASKILGLAASGYLIFLARGTWWLLPAMLVHGIQVVFLFPGLHECVHMTPFRTRWLNTGVGWVLSLLTFYPWVYFRHFHFTHHRHAQDPARDPELLGVDLSTRLKFLLWVSALPYWKRRLWGSLKHALIGRVTQPFIEPRFRPAIVREARIVWAVYLGIAVVAALIDPWAPVLYWLLPAALAQPLLRLYLNGEHGGVAQAGDSFATARTTLTHPAIRWLAWNMPYHTEHHLYPNVPFHALPRLHARVRGRLHNVGNGYVAVNRGLWAALRV
jgi:fatty acid desaturase